MQNKCVKMTKSKTEIKQGLYKCSTDCGLDCPYFSERQKLCVNALMSDALELIEQQEKEQNNIYDNFDIEVMKNERTIF